MKKALSLLLALVLCLSLCSCGKSTSNSKASADEKQQYAGTWQGQGVTIHLYDDGVCLYHGDDYEMAGANSFHGTWDIRENHIVLRLAQGHYVAYKISDDSTLIVHTGGTLIKKT